MLEGSAACTEAPHASSPGWHGMDIEAVGCTVTLMRSSCGTVGQAAASASPTGRFGKPTRGGSWGITVPVNQRNSGDGASGVVGNDVITATQSEACRRRPCTACVRTVELTGNMAAYPDRADPGMPTCGTTSTLIEFSTMVEFSGADVAMLLEADATSASMAASNAVLLYCAELEASAVEKPRIDGPDGREFQW